MNVSRVHSKYLGQLGTAGRELYTQFMIRIINEIHDCYLAEFSTLKTLQGSAFSLFRRHFNAKLLSLFLTPAYTFDNVKGQFPIGFFIWRTSERIPFSSIFADVYNADGIKIGTKKISVVEKSKYINPWISSFKNDDNEAIGFLDGINGNDFQHNGYVYIVNNKSQVANPRGLWINPSNIFACCIYFAVRHVIPATWLNDRDQFLYPNDGWKGDMEFQTDCLVYTLFNNNIQSKFGTNYWIPFTEEEVGAQEAFESHFMSDFLRGKASKADSKTMDINSAPVEQDLFAAEPLAVAKQYPMGPNDNEYVPLEDLSLQAKTVMDAGRELWRYYHSQPNANPNASLYDIRLHFQGYKTTKTGKVQMNTESDDEQYTVLITDLRQALKELAKAIEPKVYEYGFLLK